MRQRAIIMLCGIFLGAGFLSGCARTPEESLVKQKGEASLKNYEEGQSLTGSQTEDGGSGTANNEKNDSLAAAEDGESGTGTGDIGNNGSGTAASGENSGSGTAASGENSGSGTAAGGENSGSGTAAGGENSGSGTAAGGEISSAEQNILRQSLGAPEHYQSEAQDETGRLQILTDADVEIPNADKVSAIAVSQHPFDQTVMDRITDTFFPEAVIYTSKSYNGRVKADYQKEIEKLKGYVAEGNLDPYGWGTDENGNYYYDIYQIIESYEQEMQEAPEEKELVEVHPQYGLEEDNLGSNLFYGTACQPDGTVYSYIMKTYASMPMEVRLEKERETENQTRWLEYSVVSGGETDIPDEEELEQETGITLEEARKIADEKVALLQLDDMEMTSWEYGICCEENMSRQDGMTRIPLDTGYMLHYTRKLNGIPITYTTEWGGNLEDMNSEMETWGYEVLDFIVTKDGIDTVYFNNQYDIGEVRTENLSLMPFDKIMEIYEKMMVIQNADILNYTLSKTYHIDRIAFGYSRIYEPATDSHSGLLVPVWDFFGSDESVYDNEGQQEIYISDTQYQSRLTVNAIDGSIISRSLGY